MRPVSSTVAIQDRPEDACADASLQRKFSLPWPPQIGFARICWIFQHRIASNSPQTHLLGVYPELRELSTIPITAANLGATRSIAVLCRAVYLCLDFVSPGKCLRAPDSRQRPIQVTSVTSMSPILGAQAGGQEIPVHWLIRRRSGFCPNDVIGGVCQRSRGFNRGKRLESWRSRQSTIAQELQWLRGGSHCQWRLKLSA